LGWKTQSQDFTQKWVAKVAKRVLQRFSKMLRCHRHDEWKTHYKAMDQLFIHLGD